MLAAVVALGLAVLLLGVLVVGLLRSHAEILRRLHELGAGLDDDTATVRARAGHVGAGPSGLTQAHDLSGTLLDGSTAAIAVVGTEHDTVLAFLSSTCLSCEPFWDTFRGAHALPDRTRLTVVVQDGDSEKRLRKLAGGDLLVVRSDQAWTSYDVPGSPHFVHVQGGSGMVLGEGTGETWEQVLDLLQHAGQRPDDPRDNAERIDRELAASGIGPGHTSLYGSLDAPADGTE